MGWLEKLRIKLSQLSTKLKLKLKLSLAKDLCTNKRARVVNARTHVKTCARAFTTLVCAFVHGFFWWSITIFLAYV